MKDEKIENLSLENLSLEKLANGAIPLLFMETLSEKLLPNIFDLNTDRKKERAICLEIRFKPILGREGEVTGADIIIPEPKLKLVPATFSTHVLLGKINDKFQAQEIHQMIITKETASHLKAIK